MYTINILEEYPLVLDYVLSDRMTKNKNKKLQGKGKRRRWLEHAAADEVMRSRRQLPRTVTLLSGIRSKCEFMLIDPA